MSAIHEPQSAVSAMPRHAIHGSTTDRLVRNYGVATMRLNQCRVQVAEGVLGQDCYDELAAYRAAVMAELKQREPAEFECFRMFFGD